MSKRFCVLTMIFVATQVAFGLPSGAYSRGGQQPGGPIVPNCGPTITYSFENPFGHPWSDAKKAEVRAGLSQWETDVADADTSQVVTFTEVSNGEIDIYLKSLGSGNLGLASCSGGFLELNNTLTGNHLQGVAAHEAGHVAGLAHVPQTASASDPTMTLGACYGTESQLLAAALTFTTLERDDHAAAHQRNGFLDRMQADPSFEKSSFINWWGFDEIAAWDRFDGPDDPFGQFHLRFKGFNPLTSADPRISQTELIYHPNTFDMGAWLRKHTSGAAGTVTMRLEDRQWAGWHATSGSCDIGPVGDWNTSATTVLTLTNAWEFYETPNRTIAANYVVKTSLTNNLSASGQRDYVRVDAIAARAL